MNRIKVDFPSMSPHMGNCPYTYSFSAAYGLDHSAKNSEGLGKFLDIDTRPIILETVVKEFTIELRKKLYEDDVETMIMSDLAELIKPEPFEAGKPRIKNLKAPSLLDLAFRKLKFW